MSAGAEHIQRQPGIEDALHQPNKYCSSRRLLWPKDRRTGLRVVVL